ncbi:MAG: tetratricopeptide repeat protein [bacterium]
MAFEDIEKLKERFSKDPSKISIPLSEEYRKAGMLDDAIQVLQKGLEAQPHYMSARVALGKVYCEKGMIKEAQQEFEQVAKAIPDNLFAHKKLAEIYKDLGDPEKAIKEYQTVVRLNPFDEDAKINIESLLGSQEAREKEKQSPQEQPKAAPEAPPPPVEEKPKEEEAFSDIAAEELPEEILQAPQPASAAGDDFEAFRQSVASDMRGLEDAPPAKEEETPMFHTGEDPERTRGLTLGIEPKGESDETVRVPEPEQPAPPQMAAEGFPDTFFTQLKEIEGHIERNEFSRAFHAYRDLLKQYPADKRLLQKIEELRTYMKMIGKEKEELIQAMESFLSGIQRRKDEFHRGSQRSS